MRDTENVIVKGDTKQKQIGSVHTHPLYPVASHTQYIYISLSLIPSHTLVYTRLVYANIYNTLLMLFCAARTSPLCAILRRLLSKTQIRSKSLWRIVRGEHRHHGLREYMYDACAYLLYAWIKCTKSVRSDLCCHFTCFRPTSQYLVENR